jgi:hypothetical protein
MDNQHRKIKGYRELSQAEIDLMNEVKAHGEKTRELLTRVRESLQDAAPINYDDGSEADHPMYWLRTADSSFRHGTMQLVRAIAKPESF